MTTTRYYFDVNVDFNWANEFIYYLKEEDVEYLMNSGALNREFQSAFGKVMDRDSEFNPIIRKSDFGYPEIVVSNVYHYADDLNRFFLFHGFDCLKADDCKMWCGTLNMEGMV